MSHHHRGVEPVIMLDDFSGKGDSYRFAGFSGVLEATSLEDVVSVLEGVDREVRGGRHAVGFVSYDASPGIDPCLTSHRGAYPLAWFALYRERYVVPPGAGLSGGGFSTGDWSDSVDLLRYGKDFDVIREAIADGETYQVNYTFQRRFRFQGDPLGLYRRLSAEQTAPYCAYFDTGRHAILSASPELFFALQGQELSLCPMKGTAGRGLDAPGDAALREGLRQSSKDRAENVMIVDLLRNDAGKIALPGSVKVPSLFDVETLETVHQMTSTVTATVPDQTGITPVFSALFPCGSITGAPKRRTMEIIARLEACPRGLYTGAIGFVSPGPEAIFSVAIRTIIIDRETGLGEIGTGSGITWGSEAEGEHGEAHAKTAFARSAAGDFRLIETILYDAGEWFLLPRHLERLRNSARRFGFPFDSLKAISALGDAVKGTGGSLKVRLLLGRDGGLECEAEKLPAPGSGVLPVAWAGVTVDSRDLFRYHKTTIREQLDAARRCREDCSDVIFRNERGEVTESSTANVVLYDGERLVTPPVGAGLLAGTFRQELVARGVLQERTILPAELQAAGEFFLVNSVRRWRRVRLVP